MRHWLVRFSLGRWFTGYGLAERSCQEATMADTKWTIKGREFINCNCSYGCPCQFNGLPTHGDCQAVGGFEIEFVGDPVGSGFVASLAHPGRNITGFANFENSIGSKWLEQLKEIAPAAKRAGFIFNPDAAPNVGFFHAAESAAEPLVAPVIDHDGNF